MDSKSSNGARSEPRSLYARVELRALYALDKLRARIRATVLAAVVASAAQGCVVAPPDAGNANATSASASANAANGNSNANAAPTVAPSVSEGEGSRTAVPPVETPTPAGGATPAPAPPPGAPTPGTTAASLPGSLLIPVEGVRPEQLLDTFTQSRSEGRAHNAIDIIAPKGTPVLAATDGRVVKLFQSAKGGITIYQRGTDGKTIYYYAHLDRYADGVAENKDVRRGELLGYVGDTGNATPGNYHLHFAIWITQDPKRYWEGANLNPYPLLTAK